MFYLPEAARIAKMLKQGIFVGSQKFVAFSLLSGGEFSVLRGSQVNCKEILTLFTAFSTDLRQILLNKRLLRQVLSFLRNSVPFWGQFGLLQDFQDNFEMVLLFSMVSSAVLK